jgi:hypothetical protein
MPSSWSEFEIANIIDNRMKIFDALFPFDNEDEYDSEESGFKLLAL